MNALFRKSALVALASSFAWTVGCGTEASPSDASERTDEASVGDPEERTPVRPPELRGPSDEIRVDCTKAELYFAAIAQGTCAPVDAAGGRWEPEDLFADAPEAVRAFACAFRWQPQGTAKPDHTALLSALGTDAAVAPICGAASFLVPEVVPVERRTFAAGPMSGSVGCDVCGFVWDDRLFTVLPPDRVQHKVVDVRLGAGRTKTFSVTVPPGVRAAVVGLPAEAGGYLPGHVTVY